MDVGLTVVGREHQDGVLDAPTSATRESRHDRRQLSEPFSYKTHGAPTERQEAVTQHTPARLWLTEGQACQILLSLADDSTPCRLSCIDGEDAKPVAALRPPLRQERL